MISLKKLCLKLVIREFERLYFAFAVSDNDTVKRNFEFLQRKYSFDIGTELFKRGKLRDAYLDFVLNEHLISLDVEWFIRFRFGSSMKDIFCRLPNLRYISCNYTWDGILENVAKFCPKIVEINSRDGSCVSDNGVKHLCKTENGKPPCPELRKLSIDSMGVTKQCLMYLINNLPFLEKIDHERIPEILYSLHKEDVCNSKILPTYNMVYLDLFYHAHLSYFNELLKVCLAVCPMLKSIRCPITKKEQLDLLNNRKLEEIQLYSLQDFPKIDINSFLKINGNSFVSLRIFNFILSINDLTASCSKLRNLYLDRITFLDDEDRDNYSQAVLHYLNECTLDFGKPDSATIKQMSLLLLSTPNLENITFRRSFYPESKTLLLKYCEKYNLKHISFPCFACFPCNRRDEMNFVKRILKICSSLETLSLDKCVQFEKDEIKEFAKFVETLSNKPDVYCDGWSVHLFKFFED